MKRLFSNLPSKIIGLIGGIAVGCLVVSLTLDRRRPQDVLRGRVVSEFWLVCGEIIEKTLEANHGDRVDEVVREWVEKQASARPQHWEVQSDSIPARHFSIWGAELDNSWLREAWITVEHSLRDMGGKPLAFLGIAVRAAGEPECDAILYFPSSPDTIYVRPVKVQKDHLNVAFEAVIAATQGELLSGPWSCQIPRRTIGALGVEKVGRK